MTREERVKLNRKRQIRRQAKIVIIGCACIISGSIRSYYYGYKDNSVANGITYSLLFIGWIILLLAFGMRFYSGKKIIFKKNKPAWVKQKLINAALFITFAFLVAGNMIVIDNMANARIHHILKTEPVGYTVAVVTAIETHSGRGGSKEYARFEYTVSGETISKAVYNYNSEFIVGKKYPITYSLEYPEMFEINTNAVL